MEKYHSASGSSAENLFISIFSETFGLEKAGFLYTQYPFSDIYQNSRFADFLLENGAKKIAIEIDDEASHNPRLVSKDKFTDDLLKQNSMINMGWDVYRWTVRQMQQQPDTVKDELRIFMGNDPRFKEIDDYLPTQGGKSFSGIKLEIREYQQEALASLEAMRKQNETIALLHHATGTGKTVTAVLDAKKCGGRVLFVAHTMELINQAYKTFSDLWSEVSIGTFADGIKQTEEHVICGSIQSIALNLDLFKEDAFDYVIIDEAHHAAADSYQRVLAYFKPKFTLGLTATAERADDLDILDTFKRTAHRLDIKTAVEIGALTNVRCIRIHTNIDMTKVRFNSVNYNIRELDTKICVTERNNLIVNTWLKFVKDKRTVVFCASVAHSKLIADLFIDKGIDAMAVSGSMKTSERNEALSKFAEGKVKVLCACDLLNEGWDCPETEVLFMARPTMSKVLYTQQLGRGMRNADGKEYLMVFDFVDNANQFNAPYSLHRLFRLKDYHPGGTVIGGNGYGRGEGPLYERGEKPDAIIDYPVDATDYELVDVFNWQDEIRDMISQMEFIRRVNVQSETIERYIREGIIVPDLVVPISEHRTFKFFKEETLQNYAKQFGWTLIDDSNRKAMFMDMVEKMDMSYSYKPVFLKAILKHADKSGKANISDIVDYFIEFYEHRKEKDLIVEKANSIYTKGGYTKKEVERNILSNPFKRFEDMNMIYHTKTIGIICVDKNVWKRLTSDDKIHIGEVCDNKINDYYRKISSSKHLNKN